jgi:GDPmannose 4,6-dehydratase
MTKKKAIVTGANGQDGYYLSELLLSKDYDVLKVDKDVLDISDTDEVFTYITENKPDEIYNLAGMSHVGMSFKKPVEVLKANSLGVANLLDALYRVKPKAKFFQASSSVIYNPTNPYSISKLYAHQMVEMYRNKYNLFAVNGVLFNHESPLRQLTFVTQKVAFAAACAKLGLKTSKELNEEGEPIVKNGKVLLGDLDAVRDWGYAGDYVKAMWQMLQLTTPDDFQIATGETHSIRELCDVAFKHMNLDYRDYVLVDERFVRPKETNPLVADVKKTKDILGWTATTKFGDLIKMMVNANMEKVK